MSSASVSTKQSKKDKKDKKKGRKSGKHSTPESAPAPVKEAPVLAATPREAADSVDHAKKNSAPIESSVASDVTPPAKKATRKRATGGKKKAKRAPAKKGGASRKRGASKRGSSSSRKHGSTRSTSRSRSRSPGRDHRSSRHHRSYDSRSRSRDSGARHHHRSRALSLSRSRSPPRSQRSRRSSTKKATPKKKKAAGKRGAGGKPRAARKPRGKKVDEAKGGAGAVATDATTGAGAEAKTPRKRNKGGAGAKPKKERKLSQSEQAKRDLALTQNPESPTYKLVIPKHGEKCKWAVGVDKKKRAFYIRYREKVKRSPRREEVRQKLLLSTTRDELQKMAIDPLKKRYHQLVDPRQFVTKRATSGWVKFSAEERPKIKERASKSDAKRDFKEDGQKVAERWRLLGEDGQKEWNTRHKPVMEEYNLIRNRYKDVKAPRNPYIMFCSDQTKKNKIAREQAKAEKKTRKPADKGERKRVAADEEDDDDDSRLPQSKLAKMWKKIKHGGEATRIEYEKWNECSRMDHVRACMDMIAYSKLMDESVEKIQAEVHAIALARRQTINSNKELQKLKPRTVRAKKGGASTTSTTTKKGGRAKATASSSSSSSSTATPTPSDEKSASVSLSSSPPSTTTTTTTTLSSSSAPSSTADESSDSGDSSDSEEDEDDK